MGELPDLVRRAPGPLRSLACALSTWMHPERLAVVRERLADLYGYAAPDPVDVDPRPEDEWRSTAYVVVAPPDRWRIVERGHVEACDGTATWSGTSTLVTQGSVERASLRDAGVVGLCLYPAPVLTELDFGAPEAGEVEGRACWVADARPRASHGGAPPPDLALSGGRRLSAFVGVDHRFWFDAETGVVLRHQGSVDGEACSTIVLTDLVVDRPLGSVEFGPPPGSAVRSRHELLRDHLAEMGIDPDEVDLDDSSAVRRAIRGG
jgi:hypothetical protein